MVDIFEVNRKECARLLLEYLKWTLPGTFKPKPGAPPPEVELVVTHESTILDVYPLATIHKLNVILTDRARLITGVCKLSPQTVGAAVGKSIRKLYNSLSDGLDIDISRRFTEWFSIHMSNFNFAWIWKEWVPDLNLAVQHPKRDFMRRSLELEIQAMHFPDAYTIPEQAPGPNFEYDDPSRTISTTATTFTNIYVLLAKLHHGAAQNILNLFRGRSKAEGVIAHLDTLRNTLEFEASETGQSLDMFPPSFVSSPSNLSFILDLVVASGSSSTPTNGSPEAKVDILRASLTVA
ncbi:ARM repeat-containing protein [Dendrothele bispora CBS 962.96]|uniref:ARM repeat-containing protein n=1 Tax=Dendrothele bispora (strain CBS 962.96) TaxID=1314807 RepID=A0A4S8M645_DENBC|nr:ARM repeat-containing protein [Dendrothele bispora CBS 962.96]